MINAPAPTLRKCSRIDAESFSCPMPVRPHAPGYSLWLYASEGSDRVAVRSELTLKPFLIGRRGNDTLIDGDGKSLEAGGVGADTLRGGDGHDYLRGDSGKDRMYGGAGNDKIHANHSADDLDLAIDCGAGKDLAARDKADPWSRHCETRRVRHDRATTSL
jgi:hypothetical protein